MAFDPLVPHTLDEEAPPAVVINPHSAYGKELRKWEQHRTYLVPPGTNPGNPYVFRPYPKMLYRAQRKLNGQWRCMEPTPHPYEYPTVDEYQRAVLANESFNRSCYRLVQDESEERLAKGQGWSESPTDAMDLCQKEQDAVGTAAAEAAYAAAHMSEKAQREYDDASRQTSAHVTDVKGSKRGRKPKIVAPHDLDGVAEG